jgi:hypothetical protein
MITAAIEIGALSGWVTVLVVIGAAWVFWRGGGGTALASLETANRILEKRVHDLEAQVKLDQATIAELQARTDITLAVKPLIDAVMQHENQAQARFEKTLTVLGQIGKRLEPAAA